MWYWLLAIVWVWAASIATQDNALCKMWDLAWSMVPYIWSARDIKIAKEWEVCWEKLTTSERLMRWGLWLVWLIPLLWQWVKIWVVSVKWSWIIARNRDFIINWSNVSIHWAQVAWKAAIWWIIIYEVGDIIASANNSVESIKSAIN